MCKCRVAATSLHVAPAVRPPHPKRGAPRSTLRRPPHPAPRRRRRVHTRPAKPLELHGHPGGSPSQPQDRRGAGGQALGYGGIRYRGSGSIGANNFSREVAEAQAAARGDDVRRRALPRGPAPRRELRAGCGAALAAGGWLPLLGRGVRVRSRPRRPVWGLRLASSKAASQVPSSRSQGSDL